MGAPCSSSPPRGQGGQGRERLSFPVGQASQPRAQLLSPSRLPARGPLHPQLPQPPPSCRRPSRHRETLVSLTAGKAVARSPWLSGDLSLPGRGGDSHLGSPGLGSHERAPQLPHHQQVSASNRRGGKQSPFQAPLMPTAGPFQPASGSQSPRAPSAAAGGKELGRAWPAPPRDSISASEGKAQLRTPGFSFLPLPHSVLFL